jgi:uncharacterized protein (DUF2062 family)
MKSDWRDFRPAIWVAMLGVALVLVVNPPYVGAIFLGAAIGLAIRIRQRRSAPPPASKRRRKRR